MFEVEVEVDELFDDYDLVDDEIEIQIEIDVLQIHIEAEVDDDLQVVAEVIDVND